MAHAMPVQPPQAGVENRNPQCFVSIVVGGQQVGHTVAGLEAGPAEVLPAAVTFAIPQATIDRGKPQAFVSVEVLGLCQRQERGQRKLCVAGVRMPAALLAVEQAAVGRYGPQALLSVVHRFNQPSHAATGQAVVSAFDMPVLADPTRQTELAAADP